MKIIGCDFHPSYQQIAMMDTETGELWEGRLEHEQGEARRFYQALQGQTVRVGMEAVGNSHWFEQLLAELGARVVDRRCGADSAVGGTATEDRPSRCQAHSGSAAGWTLSPTVGAQPADARCAAVVAAPTEAGGDSHAGEEPVAASGSEPGRAAQEPSVECSGSRCAGAVAAAAMD